METYSTPDIIRILKNKGITLFSLEDFERLFNIKNRQTLYKKIQRLEQQKLIKRLIKGKYSFALNEVNHYQISNYLCRPSYITLESALSFYGIITGFPYKISSFTTKKSRTFIINQQEYHYCHISQKLFWGYEKQNNFLMASKEKAILDYLYFSFKGLRQFDRQEFDFSGIKKTNLKQSAKRLNNPQILSVVQKL